MRFLERAVSSLGNKIRVEVDDGGESGFDVDKIAKSFECWELKNPYPNYWTLERDTPDGRHLMLDMDLSEGWVKFSEIGKGSEEFNVNCVGIERIRFITSRIVIFNGSDVEYQIGNEGDIQAHSIVSVYSGEEIASRTYSFTPRTQ